MTAPTRGTGPRTELDPRYSSPDAVATPWATARERLAGARTYAVVTVRPDGRPHLTPVIALWLDEALWFCTGPDERKARNLAGNPHCVVTVASSTEEGLDVVVEGEAVPVHDDAALHRAARAYGEKYGPQWHFDVADGDLRNDVGGPARLFRVAPRAAFGFAKGEPFGQTRWTFDHD